MTIGYRLSHRQRQLWQQHAGAAGPGIRFVVAVDGPVDPARLRRALGAVVLRHEALRTIVRAVPGQPAPVQVVAPEEGLEWRALDLGGQPESIVDELLAAPPSGPPLAASYVPAGSGGGYLVGQVPALTADARSVAVVVEDLARLHHGGPGGQVAGYPQYAEWQHQLTVTGDPFAAAHWRRVAAGAVTRPRLPLETDRSSCAHRLRGLALDRDLDGAVRALAEKLRTTVDTVGFAAWWVLLRRLTGQDPLTVDWTLDGRDHPELRSVVGPFARPVPATVTPGPRATLADVVAEAQRIWAEHTRWLDWLEADPATGGFGYEAVAWPDAVDGFTLTRLRTEPAADVALVLHDRQPIRLELCYRPLLHDDDAEILLEQIRLVLAAAVADPQLDPAELALVTPRERTRMAAANDTGDRAPEPIPVHRRFAERAAATPDAAAVACGDTVVTYAELDRRANRVASALRDRGIGRGTVCAVWHGGGIPLLETLLGVLKAGAAYLPIEAAWPRARVLALLRDAAPAAVLTDLEPATIGTLPVPVLRLDGADAPSRAGADEVVDAGVTPDDLAYLIYTSGSTGTPKGVAVTHGGLDNYLSWCRSAYPVAAGRGSLVHSSIAADMTVTPLFAPLFAGGCVRFTEPAGIEGLVRELTGRDDFGLVKLTPAHLGLLTRMLPEGRPAGLARALVIGGEALTEQMLEPWRAAAPGTRLLNEYGPTETVVGCCVHDGTVHSGRSAVPIGRPVTGARLYVLDAAMRQVPLGTPGELYIGGAGVARGYHGRAGLTAERFLPDPFGPRPGARLYRTGDLARYLPDGALEFLGRLDDQEQVNGYRVEPAEVEAALAAHPAVAAAAVGVQREDGGPARLVACVVPAAEPPDPDDVRRFARECLPGHMVPATVVVTAALPVTGSGKVDRAAVAELAATHPAPAAPNAPTESRRPAADLADVERTVIAVVEETLGYQGVGAADNFFDLGGDSFLLLDAAVRLEAEFGVEVTPLMLLEHPTIAAISRVLAGADAPPGGADGGQEPDQPAGGDQGRRQRDAIDDARRRRSERREP